MCVSVLSLKDAPTLTVPAEAGACRYFLPGAVRKARSPCEPGVVLRRRRVSAARGERSGLPERRDGSAGIPPCGRTLGGSPPAAGPSGIPSGRHSPRVALMATRGWLCKPRVPVELFGGGCADEWQGTGGGLVRPSGQHAFARLVALLIVLRVLK